MVKKSYTKRYIILILLAVLVLAIIGSILIINIPEQDNESDENVVEQIQIGNDNIVINYNLFYTLESVTEQVIEGIKQGQYDEIYKLFEGANKEETYSLLREYNQAMNVSNDEIKYLTNAHKVEENIYVCGFEVQGYKQTMTIKLNTKSNTFKILDLDKWGYVDD